MEGIWREESECCLDRRTREVEGDVRAKEATSDKEEVKVTRDDTRVIRRTNKEECSGNVAV